jgi:hypothetical protein
MRRFMTYAALLTAVLLSGCSALQAAPSAKGAGDKGAPLAVGERYTWYDGDQPRQVWLDEELIAEFGAGGKTDTMRSVSPQAQEVPTDQRGVRLWRVPAGSARALAQLRSAEAGKYSPVLRDGTDAQARMRALPGNVIVHLNPSWSEAQVSAWLEQKGLEPVRKLSFGTNVYLLRSAPGLESLELANRLYESGEVVAAIPEWWQEVTTR